MVAELAARHALPGDVIDGVAERSGGVPLFVEEVTRLLLERGEHGGVQAIPPTLQQSLMARLDRLGPAREVAQVGSVIGRGFSYKLLRDVAGMDDAPLQAALEKLAEADIVLVQGLPPESDYRFKHALIQDAAYENLLKSRRQVLHRRVAETLRDGFADTAAAEPEVLAHHFTQAGMTDAAIEWWGKAGDQALRRSAFQEAIAHLGRAIEMADKSASAAAVTAPPASARLKLQTSLGNALIAARGHGAPETSRAFARASELAAGIDDPLERLSANYGVWVGSFSRGEVGPLRATSAAILRDVASKPLSPEAALAHRLAGATAWYAGDFVAARRHLDQALAIFDPQRDRELTYRFGQDMGVAIRVFLAYTLWPLGEIERAGRVSDDMLARAAASGHTLTQVFAHFHYALLKLTSRDPAGVAPHADTMVSRAREHGMQLYNAYGSFLVPWAAWRLGDRTNGLAAMRRGIAACHDMGNALFTTLFETALAEAEAEAGEISAALETIDDVVALTERTGQRWNEADTHRARGEILLKRDPANPAPAEEAFLTAIAVAHEQKARSFGLRGALSLAKLYQSAGRAADAHAVLAPALEGFSPTPEFPEIEQAQMLLNALAETEQVKNAAAARQRRLKLQTSYGNALIAARGDSAPETTAAFGRARDLAAAVDDPMERLSAYYGLWVGSLSRGEADRMRAIAEVVLRDIEGRPQSPEAAMAYRLAGTTEWYLGNFELARAHLEQALAMFDPQRGRDLTYRFGRDIGVSATVFMALVLWPMGETDRALKFGEEALARAVASGHMLSKVYGHFQCALFHVARRDAAATAPLAEAVVKLAREHDMPLYNAYGEFLQPWAQWHLGDRNGGLLTAMRRGITACQEMDNAVYMTLLETALAETAADAGEIEAALASIDRVVALTERTGQRWNEADTHRVRGEIVLKHDSANTAPAEKAFLTAIAHAQRQKARSLELRAALSLAKLYQSADRAVDAHVVLASALEGFSPTPQFPEIGEAQDLFATLGKLN
jgi:predicted ATPase